MAFKFDDTAPLPDNLATYAKEVSGLDGILGPVLAARLEDLIAGADADGILDQLLAALVQTPKGAS
ncbi:MULTISPECIES: hypothetical protein [unclassified Bradyrhizobium]|uniref:hypothetical protein n=1 Tax=unclassified Bradyrhizobium TaxID=2631580 RepID=UPI0020B3A603|nr:MULTISPECIES: hypothetical protein [unclassified Bradyrhizobium]MCP3468420.1 hypothetical protein [Bradyrhizobium sp. CCGUVB23]MCP3477767.1 hypothetical protein [Bradyrhizobium sp. CCGUVB1N3]